MYILKNIYLCGASRLWIVRVCWMVVHTKALQKRVWFHI